MYKPTRNKMARLIVFFMLLSMLAGCGGVKIVRIPIPIPTFGIGGSSKPAAPKTTVRDTSQEQKIPPKNVTYGLASWYGRKFNGKTTASGERYNMYDYTAAHRTLPFNTKLRVTNLENGKKCIVRINDRGPFVDGRILDVSYQTAKMLDFVQQGLTQVKIEVQ